MENNNSKVVEVLRELVRVEAYGSFTTTKGTYSFFEVGVALEKALLELEKLNEFRDWLEKNNKSIRCDKDLFEKRIRDENNIQERTGNYREDVVMPLVAGYMKCEGNLEFIKKCYEVIKK